MEQIKNVNEILNLLECIENGWCDIEKNVYRDVEKGFKRKYVLSTPEEVEKNKVGTSFDIVELERTYFKGINMKFDTYFMIYYDSKKIFAHTFIVYEQNEKFYWFEYALNKYKGIHEYLSLFDLLTDIKSKFVKHHNIRFMDEDYLCIYKYKKPKAHIGLKDFYKHCESGENVLI